MDSPNDPPVTVEALDALVKDLFRKRKEIEASEAVTTTLNKEKSALENKIVGYLRALNRENFQAPDGTVSVKQVWRVSNPKTDEDKSKLFDWLKSQGIYDKYATVNNTSLNSLFLAEWNAAKKTGDGLGFTLPGLEQPKLFETLGVRKGKGSSDDEA